MLCGAPNWPEPGCPKAFAFPKGFVAGCPPKAAAELAVPNGAAAGALEPKPLEPKPAFCVSKPPVVFPKPPAVLQKPPVVFPKPPVVFQKPPVVFPNPAVGLPKLVFPAVPTPPKPI